MSNIYDVNIELLEKLEPLKLYVVGSIARKEENPKDIDYITLEPLVKIAEKIKFDDVNRFGPHHLNFDYKGYSVDVWKANNINELHAMFVLRTIDKTHNIAYRKLAKKKEWKLTDKGLYDDDGNRIHFEDETELRKILGVKEKIKK